MSAGHNHDKLEQVEEFGFYSVVGMIAVGVISFAGIIVIALKALSGVGTLFAGL